MSEEGHEGRQWRLYVRDMVESGDKVQLYTEGLDGDAFVVEDLIYDVTLRKNRLIGEAAPLFLIEVREAHPEIQWRQIA